MDHFMTDSEEMEKHASAMVAPLNIQKSPKRSQSRGPIHSRQSSTIAPTIRSHSPSVSQSYSHSQPSPPLTPHTETHKEESPLEQPEAEPQAVFHNYLRAFYHFHPSSTVSSTGDESSITIPIDEGDVILVHSVHPNGWADGTLLSTQARGWLPTNYCHAYDHPTIRNLLNALTQLWDLVRDGEHEGILAPFIKYDYVRTMIAGVRCFLEKTGCLTRQSWLIKEHAGLRRMRKGLLSDLSALARTARELQDVAPNGPSREVFALLDQLVANAFKLATRAVRFLDIWEHDAAAMVERDNRPPTPPSDSAETVQPPATSNQARADGLSADDDAHRVTHDDSAATHSETEGAAMQPPRAALNRISVAFSIPSDGDSLQSPLLPPGSAQVQGQQSSQTKRWSVSHRVSYTGKSHSGVRKQHLASERLSAAHDSFLGFIGSFIGLHLQSRSSEELTSTTQQSVIACRQLLAVVEEVWERDSRRSDQLELARNTMYTRLSELVQATKHLFGPSDLTEDDEVVMPEPGLQLVTAATSCVRAAGDCVTKAKVVIERIGDFEFENVGLALSDSIFEGFDQLRRNCDAQTATEPVVETPAPAPPPLPTLETDKPLPAPPTTATRQLLPPLVISESKPLPDVPAPSPREDNTITLQPVQSAQPSMVDSPTAPSFRSSRSSLPPLNHLPTPNFTHHSPSESSASPGSATHRFFPKSMRADSVNASVADTNSTYRYSMRGDTASVISQASTRATTPEQSPAKQQSSQTLGSSFGSTSELRSMASEDVAASEEQLLQTTYAHELVYNKDGQISGGSLPALVEQLTSHEAAPDVQFVTTFYLTFRLFTTPTEFAQCLIERFDYIGDSTAVGIPVKLRVYNVFKSWLESHWLGEADSAALDTISDFAMGKLQSLLPNAGKRLTELTSRVRESNSQALIPQQMSAITTQTIPVNGLAQPEATCPNPIITKSQLSVLKHWKDGKIACTVMDFEPLELARQITIVESALFRAIQPEELLAQEWVKKTGSKAVNVRAMSTLSTDFTNMVVDSILALDDAKKRAAIIKHWVKIAVKCLGLKNYQSVMAIICSLNSSMVMRLKKTWDLVSTKTKARLEELKIITDVHRNYAVLRQHMQNLVAPCIPFVGLYLTDLTFVDVGNGATRPLPGDAGNEGATVINFDKHVKTAKLISQLQSFQVPYRLVVVPEIQGWMEAEIQRVRDGDTNVQTYYRRSLFLEPRDKAAPPPQLTAESSGSSTITAESRNSSKDRFDFLNFHFNTIKDHR